MSGNDEGGNSREEMLTATGNRLRLLRLAVHGVNNQASFCALYGYRLTTWNNYERGLNRPKPEDAIRLKRQFGVTLDWIYGGSVAMMPAQLLNRMREIELQEARGSKMPRAHREKSVAA